MIYSCCELMLLDLSCHVSIVGSGSNLIGKKARSYGIFFRDIGYEG